MRKGSLNYEAKQDAEANYFARSLLMPESMIEPEFKRLIKHYTLQVTVRELAKIFKVETVHVTLRLRDLKWI